MKKERTKENIFSAAIEKLLNDFTGKVFGNNTKLNITGSKSFGKRNRIKIIDE